MNKREFLKDAIVFFPAAGLLKALSCQAAEQDPPAAAPSDYDATDHWYGMGIDVDKCIGCNRCVEACKIENGVPDEPFYFRTCERYRIRSNGETTVECISTRPAPVDQVVPKDPSVIRTFFVPKLCNQCAHPPCVQVCPVGATFQTKDGVVLVDEKRCMRKAAVREEIATAERADSPSKTRATPSVRRRYGWCRRPTDAVKVA